LVNALFWCLKRTETCFCLFFCTAWESEPGSWKPEHPPCTKPVDIANHVFPGANCWYIATLYCIRTNIAFLASLVVSPSWLCTQRLRPVNTVPPSLPPPERVPNVLLGDLKIGLTFFFFHPISKVLLLFENYHQQRTDVGKNSVCLTDFCQPIADFYFLLTESAQVPSHPHPIPSVIVLVHTAPHLSPLT